jgi:Flp pilus assembly protein TadG
MRRSNPPAGADPVAPTADERRRLSEQGQAIVMVALLLTSLMGFIGLVVDVGWYQLNLVKVQRTADAAALAGSVYLPGNVPGAQTAARASAKQNGYDSVADPTVSVVPSQDPGNNQMLNVVVTAPVRTWFMRVFGVNQITASRNARAEFILPVPMGSPQNYYGISQLCANTGCTQVNGAAGGGPLASQGFWGAVITKGGNRNNGDLYSTFYNFNPTTNTQYDANGYSYLVDIPAGMSNGAVYIYDPTFCATGKGNISGSPLENQQLGTGDHWIGSGPAPVTTEFKLWDTNGTPYSTSDDVLITSDGGLFTNKQQVDKSAAFAGNQDYGGGVTSGSGLTDCQSDIYHNRWWTMTTGLAAGTYRLQVTTSSPNNNAVNGENMFGIMAKATGAGNPRVYGQSRMCTYNNVPVNSSQTFYLAQIAAVHAGKTLEIKVHDLGDVGGDAFVKVLMPTAAGYSQATFNWSASGGGPPTSGTNATQIQVASGGANRYDNQMITITIVLPTNYTAPLPAGESAAVGGGWFKIQYDLTNGGGGNDTATWAVNIRGNPVHLVTP